MDRQRAEIDIDELRKSVRHARMVNYALTGILVVVTLAMFRQIGLEKTTYLPPTLSKSFWIAGDQVSASYLEEMGAFIVGHALNVTPLTAAEQSRVVQRYLCPALQSDYRIKSEQAVERLTRDGVATSFQALRYSPDPDNARVQIAGTHTTYVNGQRTTERDAAILIAFKNPGGKLCVSQLDEITPGRKSTDVTAAAAGIKERLQ